VEREYVDGKLVPASEAVIPVDDLAIMRGFGVFDLMRTLNGKPLFLKEHIERLEESSRQIGLDLCWSQKELIDVVIKTLHRNNHRESNIRIVITGGSSPDFITPQGKPRLLILVTKAPELPKWWYKNGVKIISLCSERSIPGAKSIDYIQATIALKQARKKNAIEAVYVNQNGHVLEGTTSNIFAFIDDTLVTPGKGILGGITRKVVLQLAGSMYAIDIRDINRKELIAAAEIFITGTNKALVPVVAVDENTIGDGRPGYRTQKMMSALTNHIAEYYQTQVI
jgi:branched-chain amino acid aminotransferase